MSRTILPDGWPRPSGYSNGIAATGEVLFVAGQIGRDETGKLVADTLILQVAQALRNIKAVITTAGGVPADIARFTWYVTDIDDYRNSTGAIGEIYREVMGKHFPAMALVEVTRLVDPGALVEIEATAVLTPRADS